MRRTIYEVKEKTGKEELWEEKEDNLIKVQVQDFSKNGDFLPKEQVRVILSLSKNAMLGLGTELIRTALEMGEDDYHWHLDAATEGRATQVFGVFLHPDSPELIFLKGEMGSLNDVLPPT